MTSTTSPPHLTVTPIIVGQPIIEPRKLDDATQHHLFAALAHRAGLNPHRTRLLRAAADPALAASLYIDLTDLAATTVREQGTPDPLADWMIDHDDLSCWMQRYTVRALTDANDGLAVLAAQTRIARLLAGFPAPATRDELTFLHHHPVALVRAAYALARDFIAGSDLS